MHGMHARLPKNFVLEERLERYGAAIETQPCRLAGCWAWACHPLAADAPEARYREVRLDLGCGKGAFAAASAALEPDVLFVCVDAEPLCIAYAAQKAVRQGLCNMVVVPASGSAIPRLFAPGEVGRIHLNFPTPYPRKRDAGKRLVLLERLLDYRHVLTPGGTVCLRTDSQPLRDFALAQLDLAGYGIVRIADDASTHDAQTPVSEYELMTVADGAEVYEVVATPLGKTPRDVAQTASLSLVDYLPANLDEMTYVPRGMQGAVTNLRNHRRRQQDHDVC